MTQESFIHSEDARRAGENLAFMRGLVEAADDYRRPFGEAYLAAGLIYGAQMVGHAAQGLGWLGPDPVTALLIGVGPTAVFLIVLWWILARHRATPTTSIVGRAIGAVFGAAGAANLALAVVIGSVALRHQSQTIWLVYPCAVFVLQGAAWLVAFALRRRAWLAVVGAGWFVAAIAMGLTIDTMPWFVLSAGLGMILLMALPGAVMVHLARKA